MMKRYAAQARLVAKPGKEQIVADFLKSALPLAVAEPDTLTWYCFQINENTFGIFDTFPTTEGRDAHMNGEIAKALMAHAGDLLAEPPVIEFMDLLGDK